MEFIKVLSTKDLASGEMKDVEANGKEILIVNLEGNFYALGNVCTHVGCLLSDGVLSGEKVKCTCHGSTYNVKTGSVVTGPAENPEPVFQVKVEKGQVLVNV
jgi:nitrite reductase/ring-hydroxylating ferredoxin subunit